MGKRDDERSTERRSDATHDTGDISALPRDNEGQDHLPLHESVSEVPRKTQKAVEVSDSTFQDHHYYYSGIVSALLFIGTFAQSRQNREKHRMSFDRVVFSIQLDLYLLFGGTYNFDQVEAPSGPFVTKFGVKSTLKCILPVTNKQLHTCILAGHTGPVHTLLKFIPTIYTDSKSNLYFDFLCCFPPCWKVWLFGTDRFSFATFLEDNRETMRYLFLKDYRGVDVNVYTREEFFDYLHYAHEQVMIDVAFRFGCHWINHMSTSVSPTPHEYQVIFKNAWIKVDNIPGGEWILWDKVPWSVLSQQKIFLWYPRTCHPVESNVANSPWCQSIDSEAISWISHYPEAKNPFHPLVFPDIYHPDIYIPQGGVSGEWYPENRWSWKILAQSRNLGNVSTECQSFVSASQRVSDFTICHPYWGKPIAWHVHNLQEKLYKNKVWSWGLLKVCMVSERGG